MNDRFLLVSLPPCWSGRMSVAAQVTGNVGTGWLNLGLVVGLAGQVSWGCAGARVLGFQT